MKCSLYGHKQNLFVGLVISQNLLDHEFWGKKQKSPVGLSMQNWHFVDFHNLLLCGYVIQIIFYYTQCWLIFNEYTKYTVSLNNFSNSSCEYIPLTPLLIFTTSHN